MSFGVGQSSIASVKSNLNLRSKRSRFKKTLSVTKTEKLEFKSKEIVPFELRRLNKKAKKR